MTPQDQPPRCVYPGCELTNLFQLDNGQWVCWLHLLAYHHEKRMARKKEIEKQRPIRFDALKYSA